MKFQRRGEEGRKEGSKGADEKKESRENTVREWRRVSLRALVDDKAVRLLCGGSLLHSLTLSLATAATRPLLAKPNVLRLALPFLRRLSTLPPLAFPCIWCMLRRSCPFSLSLFPRPPFLSLRGYSRYAFSSMYSTNATAIKRSPLRSTGREGKEGEREEERGGCKSILRRCSSDCGSHPLNWAVGSGEGKGICVRHFPRCSRGSRSRSKLRGERERGG